jgi:hypothetical protein
MMRLQQQQRSTCDSANWRTTTSGVALLELERVSRVLARELWLHLARRLVAERPVRRLVIV